MVIFIKMELFEEISPTYMTVINTNIRQDDSHDTELRAGSYSWDQARSRHRSEGTYRERCPDHLRIPTVRAQCWDSRVVNQYK